MSTYYALACLQCKVKADIVSRSAGGWGWFGEYTLVPAFIGCHRDHLWALHVIDEHDDHWIYRDFSADDEQGEGGGEADLS